MMKEEPGSMTAVRMPVKPILPSQRPRYERNIIVESDPGPFVFGPLETLSSSERDVMSNRSRDCSPWQLHVHPEGLPYYSLKHDSNKFCYVTEANAENPQVHVKLEKFTAAIEYKAKLHEQNHQIPPNVEVCLEIDGDNEWMYYMVDLDRRCVFWLDTIDLSSDPEWPLRMESKHRFQLKLASEFWIHIEHFPMSHRQHLHGLIDEVSETLSYLNIDLTTSTESTCPYGPDEMRSLVDSVKGFNKLKDWTSSSFAIVGLARIMTILIFERMSNFYGSHGARLNVFQSVHGKNPDRRSRSLLVKCLTPLLFYAPANYLWRLERLYIDRAMRQRLWQKFHDKLDSDLSGILLLLTIILAGNAGMLAVPNMLPQDGPIHFSNAAVIASRLSAIASFGGILIGLQLKIQEIRSNAMGPKTIIDHAGVFIARSGNEQLKLESLAIHYSLPYAMLMWSVVTFSVSITITCFDVVNEKPNLASRIIYIIFWSFTLIFVLWSMLTGWEFTTCSHWTDLFKPKWFSKVSVRKSYITQIQTQTQTQNEVKREEEGSGEMDLSCVEKAGKY